jgi:hypothetical protein
MRARPEPAVLAAPEVAPAAHRQPCRDQPQRKTKAKGNEISSCDAASERARRGRGRTSKPPSSVALALARAARLVN